MKLYRENQKKAVDDEKPKHLKLAEDFTKKLTLPELPEDLSDGDEENEADEEYLSNLEGKSFISGFFVRFSSILL